MCKCAVRGLRVRARGARVVFAGRRQPPGGAAARPGRPARGDQPAARARRQHGF